MSGRKKSARRKQVSGRKKCQQKLDRKKVKKEEGKQVSIQKTP